jgi:hypothetical protein
MELVSLDRTVLSTTLYKSKIHNRNHNRSFYMKINASIVLAEARNDFKKVLLIQFRLR